MYDALVRAGEEWADSKSASLALEETQKPLLSTIAVEFLDAGKSAAESERRALADPRYRQHIDAMVKARKQADRAYVRWIAAQAFGDHARTAEATKRVEIKNLGRAT